MTRDYNVKVVLDKLNPSSVNQPIFTVETANQKVIQLVLTENSGSTSTEAPYIVQVISENQIITEGNFLNRPNTPLNEYYVLFDIHFEI